MSSTEPRDLLDTPDAGPAAIRGGALRIAGYGAGVLLSVGSAALLFRHLGVEDGGRYVTVLALVSIVQGLTDVGLTSIGVREVAVREGEDRRRLVRSVIGLRIVLTSLGVVAAVGFAALAGYGSTLVVGTALAGIGLVIQNLQSTLGVALLVDLRLGWVTLLEFVRQVLVVVLIVTLVVAGAELLPFLAIPIPSAFVVLVMTAVLVRRDIPMTPSFAAAEWRVLMADILPYAAATGVAAIYFRLAIVMLSLISTAKETGYFGASFRVVEVLVVIPALIVTGAFPIFARAARDDHDRLAYGVQRMFEASALLGGWIALALVLGAGFIIDVVAGPDFAPAAAVLRIQAVTVMVMFVMVSWSYALLSLRRHREILVITVVGLVINATLVAILGSSDGARGAAVATLVADLTSVVLAGLYLARTSPAMRPDLRVVPRMAIALAAGASVVLVPGVPDVVAMAVGALVYVAVLLALHAVPEEVLVELRRLRGSPAR
jgi:O-antigen/teichoic acid export membrane protein